MSPATVVTGALKELNSLHVYCLHILNLVFFLRCTFKSLSFEKTEPILSRQDTTQGSEYHAFNSPNEHPV